MAASLYHLLLFPKVASLFISHIIYSNWGSLSRSDEHHLDFTCGLPPIVTLGASPNGDLDQQNSTVKGEATEAFRQGCSSLRPNILYILNKNYQLHLPVVLCCGNEMKLCIKHGSFPITHIYVLISPLKNAGHQALSHFTNCPIFGHTIYIFITLKFQRYQVSG